MAERTQESGGLRNGRDDEEIILSTGYGVPVSEYRMKRRTLVSRVSMILTYIVY